MLRSRRQRRQRPGGTFPGIHVAGFDSAVDTITLEHQARSRGGFARGALFAGRWIQGKQGFTHSRMPFSESKMIELKGCGTALVTPSHLTVNLDVDAYRKLVEWQIESGIDFLVPCGTTGESVTLTVEEHSYVIRVCVETASGAVPVVGRSGDQRYPLRSPTGAGC